MKDIHKMGLKLCLFKFAIEFTDEAERNMKAIKVVVDLCRNLLKNPKYLEFLRQILLVGNILTQGTRRSDALGFRVVNWRVSVFYQ